MSKRAVRSRWPLGVAGSSASTALTGFHFETPALSTGTSPAAGRLHDGLVCPSYRVDSIILNIFEGNFSNLQLPFALFVPSTSRGLHARERAVSCTSSFRQIAVDVRNLGHLPMWLMLVNPTA